jgi:O-antigen ligase
MDSLFDKMSQNLGPHAGTVGLLIAGMLAGLGAVGYVAAVNGSMMLIAALPFVLILMMMLVLDKRLLLMIILVGRASGDIVFEMSKFGGGFGVGGLINALIIFIAFLFVAERPDGITRRLASIWAPLLLVSTAALFWAPEFKDGLRMLLALASYCAVFVIAYYVVRSRKDFETWVTVILLSSIIPVLYAPVDILQNINTTERYGFRLKSTFSHANIYAFYLVLVISLLFYRLKTGMLQSGSGKRAMMWIYMLVLFALLILTKTRSAWAGCFVIFAVYGLLFERKYLVYLIFAPLLGLLIPSVRDRILDLGQGNEYVQYAHLNSFAWRVLMWESALEWMQKTKYLFGYGLNSFKYYSPVFFPLAGTTNFGAHSTYVQWLFEAGIVGILAAVWMHVRMFFTLLAGWMRDRLRVVISITLVIEYLFFAFSDNMLDYLAFNWYFWFFLGMACAVTMLPPEPDVGQPQMPQDPNPYRRSRTSNFFRSNRPNESRR